MSKEDMIIKIITEEAKEIDANIISLFTINETGNKYAIYTFNEEDAQGLVKIYASKLVLNDDSYAMGSITEVDEWTKVKEMMKDMAKENSSYIKDGIVSLINVNEVKEKSTEPLAVKLSETKAAKIGPNYKNGISNNYLTNVPSYSPTVPEVKPVVEVAPVEAPREAVSVDVPKPVEIPAVEIPAVDAIPKVEASPVIPSVPNVEISTPVIEEKEEKPIIPSPIPDITPVETPAPEPVEPKFNPIEYEKALPNVDSILNKASSSYYQDSNSNEDNNEDEDEEEEIDELPTHSNVKIIEKENIIQTIGLEFMSKVSELAEYEKDLKRREKEIEMRERGLIKIEREILTKEARQKDTIRAVKDRELDFKRREKEISDKEADLNRKILEFNKKITMFQQTFGAMGSID